MATRDEKELLGEGVYVLDNGASQQIEDYDQDTVDVEDDPFLASVVDDDGVPGFRPFVDASNNFDQGVDEDGMPDGDDSSDLNLKHATQATEATPGVAPDSEVFGDEFASRIAKRNAHHVGDDGRPVSDLAMLSSVAQGDKLDSENEAKTVRINPLSAYDALLGGNSNVTVNGPLVEVARWTADSQIESCPISIALSRVSPTPSSFQNGSNTQQPPIRPYAVIQYGTRNAAISLEVDIGAGTQFTIGATSVNVQVGMRPVYNNGAFPQTATVDMAGQLSFYPIVRTSPVTCTVYYDSFAPASFPQPWIVIEGGAGPLDVIIPPFAKKVTIYAGAGTSFAVNDSQSAQICTLTVPTGATVSSTLLLPGDAYMLTTTYPGTPSFKAVFELSL